MKSAEPKLRKSFKAQLARDATAEFVSAHLVQRRHHLCQLHAAKDEDRELDDRSISVNDLS